MRKTKRKTKKVLSLLLAIVLALGVALPVSAAPPTEGDPGGVAIPGPVTLAAWNCTTAGAGAVTAFPATSGADGFASNILTLQTASGAGSFTKAVAAVGGVPVNSEASGSSWAAWSQTVTTAMYWRLELHTQGYKNTELTFHGYGTSTSPASWEAKYSTDGTTYQSFVPAKTYTVDTTNAVAAATSVTVNLSVLDNASGAVYVGLFATTAATNASGNNRFCNVKVIAEATGNGSPMTNRITSPDQITNSGIYLLASKHNGVYYAVSATKSGSVLAATNITSMVNEENDVVTISDDVLLANLSWKFTKESNSYAISGNEISYLAYGSSTSFSFPATAEGNYLWTITGGQSNKDGTGNLFLITNVTTATRHINLGVPVNGNAPTFRAYATSNLGGSDASNYYGEYLYIFKLSDNGGNTQKAAPPTASPANGATVSDGSKVTLSCEPSGASIYYTTDGSAPTSASTLYTGPITLNFGSANSITIKAITVEVGAENSDVATFTYNKQGLLTIAAARAMATGSSVTVEGIVTRALQSSATNTTNCTLYIQDDTAGIAVYVSGITLTTFAIGAKVKVTGTLSLYTGVLQLQPASLSAIEVQPDAPAPRTPETVTVTGLKSLAYEGKLVKVEGVKLTNIATNSNHTIADTLSGQETTLRCTENTTLPGFSLNDFVDAVGVAANYNGAAQLMVSKVADVVPGTEPLPPGEVETIAEWISPTVSDVIDATGGECAAGSTLKIVGTTSTVLNWANSAINRAGGFDNKLGTAYWLFTTSGADYKNIKINFSMRSSATGPRDFKVQYSTNGTVWSDATNPNIAVPSALGIGDAASQFTKTFPSGANKAGTLYVRLVLDSLTSANNGTVASGGTNSINNIVISGEYVPAANQLSEPLTDTQSGAVPTGKVITFTRNPKDVNVAGYAVMISTDNGATWSPAVNNQFALTSLPATVQVKASAPGMVDSRVTTYSFTHAKLPMVTSSRNSGAVIPGATIRLENSVGGAAIKYKINGGAESVYTEALTLEESLFIGEPATLTVTAWAEMAGYITGDASTFSYTVTVSGGEKVYFGQLHSHTTLSDGIGAVEDAFRYARDVAGLDFFAVTDHSNSLDETGASTDNPATINLDTYNVNSEKWRRGQAAAADTYIAGKFISFYGYEMTWSGGPGHMNTFNTGGFVSRNNTALNSKVSDAGLRSYYELLTRNPESISMFNHPGITFGNFTNFAYYDPVVDQRISLIEVGNGEGAIGSGGYFPSYEQYTLALDKGWHVAPTNDQDNHQGKWGDSNTARVAIWTNDLSLNGVYQALRDMRVYATEVADLEIVYKVNGQPLGSILDVVPATANFTAEIKNPTAGNYVKSVCLVTNGGAEIQKDTPNASNYNYSRTIANPAAGYYYLRVVVATPQGDRIAVTAPVWLGEGKAAGFVEVTKSSIMPVTGEELTLTSTLFNNESKPITLMSLEYKDQTGKVLGKFNDLNRTIASTGEVSHTITYTPTVAALVTVTVTATVKFSDDSEMTYTYDISYEVWDADKLVYIGIDAFHYNEYVDGNYKDNMANFAAIAADYGVRVNILWTSEELVAAAGNPKYQALILTAPSRRVDPAAMNPSTGQVYGTHRSYSQAELNAVAAFSKAGGTVVLSGWSNIYESYAYTSTMPLDEHMASQQNKVLAALGSTLRLSDDAARDPLQWSSSTDQYRLYMTDAYGSYNWTNPLLDGVVKSQIFSQYGGSTIYTVSPNDKALWNAAPSVAVPPSVTPAIMMSLQGESVNRETNPPGTNYRTDYTKFDNRFMLLASETITNDNGKEALIIAAGGAFMSNFEVKIEMDNASTLQYSNYNIALNLIKSIAPQPEIADIANVKDLPQGSRVTIEGIATSNVYSGDNATNTGFFDCIYAQDETGGINLFPVSSGVIAGQKIRVTGTISAYQGETQIAVSNLKVVDAEINSVEPTELTTEAAMSPDNTGLLITVTGEVSDVHKTGDVVSQFTVTDGSGAGARVYINAYITTDVDLSFVKDGEKVSVTGLASIGENQTSSDPMPRIRVRNRNEIVHIAPIPITSVRINAATALSVVRGGTYEFKVILNEGAKDSSIVWSVNNKLYATVSNDGVVTILNKTGTVVLIATDPISGISHSIILRIT